MYFLERSRGDDGNNGTSVGTVRVFSGLDGSLLYTFEGDANGDRLGFSVSGAGDVDGDGFDDLIVGAAQSFTSNGRGAGDVDGDGFADLIAGAPQTQGGGAVGYARVFSGNDVSDVGTNYCGPANFNSTGQSAVISAAGSVLVQKNLLTLTAQQLPQQKFGYFLAGDTQAFVPFPGGSQGNLCLGGQIGRFARQIQSSGASGELTIQVDLTSIPTNPPHNVLAGETWNFQAWFRDKNPGNTSNFTDGISILFR